MRTELIAVASVNVIQGLPTYFFTLGLPALMREQGASLDVVALSYMVWLPWALKWLWAPYFDRPKTAPLGAHLAWLRALPVCMAAGFAVLAPLTPAGPVSALILVALFCATVGATLQVVLAAYIVHRFRARERALANGLQVAGMTAGSVLGGGVLLYLGDDLGWHAGIATIVALILAMSIPTWLLRWPRRDGSLVRQPVPAMLRPWRALSTNSVRVVACMALAGVAAGGDALLSAMLIDHGFSSSDVGWILGIVALGIMIPVSTLAGLLVRVAGARASLALLLLLKACLSAALTAPALVGSAALPILCIASFCIGSATMVAFWQLYMASVEPMHAATGFAFLTSLEALFLMIAGIGGGQLAQRLGFGSLYTVSAIAAVVCAFLLASRKWARTA